MLAFLFQYAYCFYFCNIYVQALVTGDNDLDKRGAMPVEYLSMY